MGEIKGVNIASDYVLLRGVPEIELQVKIKPGNEEYILFTG